MPVKRFRVGREESSQREIEDDEAHADCQNETADL